MKDQDVTDQKVIDDLRRELAHVTSQMKGNLELYRGAVIEWHKYKQLVTTLMILIRKNCDSDTNQIAYALVEGKI